MKDHFRNLEEKALEGCIPFRAVFELTYRCNFHCVHCYVVPRQEEEELSTEEAKGILDQLAAAGCLYLTLTGGEVFLREDFFPLASYARKRRFALRLFTNGSLLDADASRRVAALAPIVVEMSIYGASPETYRRVTGSASGFGAAMRGLAHLRGRGLPVVLKFPVMRENVGDREEVRRMGAEAGCRIVEEPRLTPRDNGDVSPLSHHVADCELMKFLPSRRDLDEALGKLPERSPDGHVCTTARTGPVIGPYGDLYACVQMKMRPAGNLRESGFADLWWKSPFLLRLRSLTFRDFSECFRCDRVRYCFWCPARALMEDGSLTGTSSYACNVTRMILSDGGEPPG